MTRPNVYLLRMAVFLIAVWQLNPVTHWLWPFVIDDVTIADESFCKRSISVSLIITLCV